jgi:tetratricopeptide (TPR) repeat protein
MRATVAWLVCAGVITCLPATEVRAEDKATEEARQHFLQGQQLFDVGRWDDAADEFEKAYATRGDPIFIYNMAQAYRRKGDAKRALDLYKNYLIKAPKSPQRAEIEDRLRALQKQLDDEAAARSSMAPPAAPAAAVVPAAPVPVAPPPLGPAPGPSSSPSTAPPASPEPAAVQTSPTTVAPTPEPVAPTPEPAAQAQPTRPRHAEPAASIQMPEPVSPRPGRGLRIAGIVTGLTGIAVVGAGIAFGAQAQSYSDSVENGNVFNPYVDERGKLYETLQWVSYGVGTGLLAAGALLYGIGVVSGRDAPVVVAPVPVAGGAGLSAQGAF